MNDLSRRLKVVQRIFREHFASIYRRQERDSFCERRSCGNEREETKGWEGGTRFLRRTEWPRTHCHVHLENWHRSHLLATIRQPRIISCWMPQLSAVSNFMNVHGVLLRDIPPAQWQPVTPPIQDYPLFPLVIKRRTGLLATNGSCTRRRCLFPSSSYLWHIASVFLFTDIPVTVSRDIIVGGKGDS